MQVFSCLFLGDPYWSQSAQGLSLVIPARLNEHLSASRVLQSVEFALEVETDSGVPVQVTGLSARISGPSLAQMADGEVH